MNPQKTAVSPWLYLFASLGTFLAAQSLVVVSHELTHSTMAWLLGAMKNPLAIVWGNPIMMTGWDEGVEYHLLFEHGQLLKAAVIGSCPLFMHALVITACFFAISTSKVRNRWIANALFWYAVANLMELVAYIFMRSFAAHGDVGIFNRGTGLSPWWFFLIASVLLSAALVMLFRTILPRILSLFALPCSPLHWGMLIATAFILFLWGSGLRVMAYVSGPQWLFGLLGIPAFFGFVWFFRPRPSSKLF